MKKSILLLIIAFLLSFVGVFAGKAIAAGNYTVTCSEPNSACSATSDPLFDVSSFAPGTSVTKTIFVDNVDNSDDCALLVKAKNMTQSIQPGDFIDTLFLSIRDNDSDTDFVGLLDIDGNATNQNTISYLDDDWISLGSINSGLSRTYTWLVTFDKDAGNDYQENNAMFDLDLNFTCGTEDKTPPDKGPQNLSVSPNPSNGKNVKVTWEAAHDNVGIDHYTVSWKKDGVGERATVVSEPTREYTIPDNLVEGIWTIKVTAHDKAGLTADASTTATVDLTAPAAPTLTLTGTGVGSVSLAWNAVDDAVDYSVWYGTATGNYAYAAHVGNVTSYTIQGLGTGTYYIVVAAYDNVVNRSAYSNEVNTGTAIAGAPGAGEAATGFLPAGQIFGAETATPTGEALGSIIVNKPWNWWIFIIIGFSLLGSAIYFYWRRRRNP